VVPLLSSVQLPPSLIKKMFLPAKYRFAVYAFLLAFCIFAIIACVVSFGKLNSIVDNSKPTAVGGYRDDSKAQDDEANAHATKVLIFLLASPFFLMLPVLVLAWLSSLSGNRGY
jgi:hypothetical protein